MQAFKFPTLGLNLTGAIVKHNRYLSLILNTGENETEISISKKKKGGATVINPGRLPKAIWLAKDIC